MPSPFHQKYSSQNHRFFGSDPTPAMPEGPKQETDRRASDASIGPPPSSPTERRRSSTTNRFAALEALKRPTDAESATRRASLQDSAIGKPGIFGSWWNNYTRGPSGATPAQQTPKEPRDTTTLRQ
ncbi:uncharacterized protein BDR25DRAFT_288010 [Lindgomyces ingoldianus]|uniref:Uncharacterized protein n=1 Tax=Lindgomyces ingoldianus TaxID=673940 RepID=A0ACB6QTA9_9PLEO|nr:uncharacterized protein BDR25DRAFT_288010 [Lindgomyces ingoldianus]KAF2470218.1 hypothetical protein BDR25DRAFT_288010 [Lindgomyces ingoldianus]